MAAEVHLRSLQDIQLRCRREGSDNINLMFTGGDLRQLWVLQVQESLHF